MGARIEKSRVPVEEGVEPCTRVTCDCGRGITLWYNGGELDADSCPCGIRWTLESRGTDLVRWGPNP